MNTSLNNGPFQRFIYKSFSPYKPRMYYPRSPKFRKEHKTIIDKGVNQNLSQSFIYSKPNQNNNFTNLSTINRFGQNIPNIANNSSYNYSIDSNQSKSSINNSYIANPIYRSATYKSTIQPNIYPNINILPTKYIGTKVYIPKIINYNEKLKMNVEPINFGYTTYTHTLQEPNIKPIQNIITTTEKIENKEYYIPTQSIPSYSTQQLSSPKISTYSTQQISNYSIPQVSNYSTPQVSNYSTEQISDYSTPQVSNYSTPQVSKYINEQIFDYSTTQVPNYSTEQISSTSQVPNYSSQQNSTYNYNNEYTEETINNKLINELVDNSKITEINNNINVDTITNTNTINDIVITESNYVPQENVIKEEEKDIYKEPEVIKNDYLINSPKIYKESIESSEYNSYIHKSPEITYRKNLFSPIQSPLANYETQSYNGDENFNIEEMLKLKEENEGYKQKIQELEDKYQAQTAEARELRIQVEQLSPLKDKLSEIDSLKAQLLELNELKNKINQLELLKYNNEEKDINEQKEEEIKSKIQNQDIIEKTEIKNELKQTVVESKVNNKQFVFAKEIENKESEIELNEENDPNYVKGEIIHSIEELTMIIRKINKNNKQITLNLLYKATADSDKAKAFHKKCDNAQSSLVLIETDKGKRFGGYTSVNWKGKCLNKKDKDAFIFSLDNMKVYENIKDKRAIGCYPKFGPIFLGCQIRIYDQAFKNGGSTFKKGFNYDTDEDYVLTGGDRLFKIKEIEVYEVIAQ